LAFLLTLTAGVASAKKMTTEDALVKLGGSIYNDKNLSLNNNQSCKSCHHDNAGFADIANANNPSVNVVSVGSDTTLTGGLNAPTASFAAFSPPMYWSEADGLFFGGIFWNGRAHGHKDFYVGCLASGWEDPVNSPLAEQSQGPFTNPVEMALPSADEVVARVAASSYASLFSLAFNTVDFANVGLTFDQIAVAIAYYETSDAFTQMNSLYDTGVLNQQQLAGEILFAADGKGQCALCHVNDGGPGGAEFTDFSYDNLGIPLNPLIADKGVNPGLGGFIYTVLNNQDAYPETLVAEILSGNGVDENLGKHKVSTVRNVALTAPYGHNGFFPNMISIVWFYNTRDTEGCVTGDGRTPVTPALLDKGFIPGYRGNEGYCWPAPEYPSNVNAAELGDLGLSPDEADDIVAFLEALTSN